MPWSTVDDQDPHGPEGDHHCLGCPALQCTLDHRVRNRLLCGHRVLQVSLEQESGCYLPDIIRDIFGFRVIVRTERLLPGELTHVPLVNSPLHTANVRPFV